MTARPAAVRQLRAVARVLRYRVVREDLWHEWRRRRAGSIALPGGPIRRVMVICHGNICRSPYAAELLARRSGGLEVRSAGLEASEGKPAEPGARRIAKRRGIDLDAHGAHRLEDPDVDRTGSSWGVPTNFTVKVTDNDGGNVTVKAWKRMDGSSDWVYMGEDYCHPCSSTTIMLPLTP